MSPDDIVPAFQFHVVQNQPETFNQVEACILQQLQSDHTSAFLHSAAFTHLRRLALYNNSHQGAIALTGHGLCVRLFSDNRVVVKWN